MLTAGGTLEMARFARGIGDVEGCLTLSEAAVRQALFEHEFDTAFLAACCPARMYLRRCEPELAVAHYRAALDLANTHRLKHRMGEVHHDLYIASRDAKIEGASMQYYGRATESYLDAKDKRIAGLLADRAEARFLAQPSMDTASAAMEHWRALPCALSGVVEIFFAGCNLMAAAAWMGSHRRFRDGLEMMENAFLSLPGHEGAAAGLVDAAMGALTAHSFPTALRLAESGLSIATERGEDIVSERARQVRNAALAERKLLA